MTSLALLYPEAKKLLHECKTKIGDLEQFGDNGTKNVTLKDLCQLEDYIKALENQVGYESASKREIWRKRVRELGDECQFLRSSLDKYLQRVFQQTKEAEEREALMAPRAGAMHSICIDTYAKESESLDRSNHMVDDLLAGGQSIVSNLGSQRDRLKGAHRKLLDVANVLGLSNSLIGVIERRDWGDKWLVYGGILLTILLLWFCWGLVK